MGRISVNNNKCYQSNMVILVVIETRLYYVLILKSFMDCFNQSLIFLDLSHFKGGALDDLNGSEMFDFTLN